MAQTPDASGWYVVDGARRYWSGDRWNAPGQFMVDPGGELPSWNPVAESVSPDSSAPTPSAPAGWYDDPELVNTRRYWDGEKWTNHRAEMVATSAPSVTVAEQEAPSDGLVLLGVLGVVLFPILGFVVGLALVNKKGDTGGWLMALSALSFLGYFYLYSTGRLDIF